MGTKRIKRMIRGATRVAWVKVSGLGLVRTKRIFDTKAAPIHV